MEETISLKVLFNTLKKRVWLLISMMVVGITIAAMVSYYFLTPMYQSATQILVDQQTAKSSTFDSTDIETNLQLINTYNVIIKSPVILSKVIEKLDLDATTYHLNSQITVSSEQNSQVVNIIVKDQEAYRAVDIANTTAAVFQEEIVNLMKVDNIAILSPAVLPENPRPIKLNPELNMVVGAVIGLMLGIGIALMLEYFDTTVKTESDIERILDLPILGLISPISERSLHPKVETQQESSTTYEKNVRI